jgi:hypothetical protein
MPHWRLLIVITLALPLSGCIRIGEWLGFRERPMVLVEGGPVCPSAAVLSDAVTVTKLKPGAPMTLDPQNVVLTAEMSQAQLECEYDGERNALTIDLDFAVRARRGAAATGPDPELEYFVAVVDAEGTVITKNIFKTQPDLDGPNGVYTQSIDNFVLQLAMDRRPIDYQVLTGFQLTAQELAYNRLPKPLPTPQPRRP